MSLKTVQKFINQIPWLPDDITVILEKHNIQYKPKNQTAKYDEKLYDKISDIIYGAKYYDIYLKENANKRKNKKK